MKKILIAEDEEILLKVLRDRFKDDGWDVTAVENGEEAVNSAKGGLYDLVLLDLIMPKMDGFEALQEIRKIPEYKEVPIIVLSNLGSDEDIKKALSLGANDYYVKTQHPVSEVIEKANGFVVKGHVPQEKSSVSTPPSPATSPEPKQGPQFSGEPAAGTAETNPVESLPANAETEQVPESTPTATNEKK